MEPLHVTHRGDDRFAISVRGHELLVDQPISDGGSDVAPTPTELFVVSLASCVAFYARRFLVRHGLPTDGLAVDATFTMEQRPARVGELRLELRVPAGVPVERRDALLAVASHCTVHNTLRRPPDVSLELALPESGIDVRAPGTAR
jgi:putative redox protein